MDCQNRNCKYYKKGKSKLFHGCGYVLRWLLHQRILRKAVPEEQKVGVEYDSERNK